MSDRKKDKPTVPGPVRRAMGRRLNLVRNPNTRERGRPMVQNPAIAKAARRRLAVGERARKSNRSRKSLPKQVQRGYQ